MKYCPFCFVVKVIFASVSAVYVWLFNFYDVDELGNEHTYSPSTQSQLNKSTLGPANLKLAGQSKWAISQRMDMCSSVSQESQRKYTDKKICVWSTPVSTAPIAVCTEPRAYTKPDKKINNKKCIGTNN